MQKLLLLAFLFLAAPVQAALPPLTAPEAVAVLYYKLSGQLPPFEIWAEAQPAFQQASPFERDRIRRQEAERLQGLYSLATTGDNVIAALPVTISDYSFRHKGFTLSGFDETTFFPYEYMGMRYAVVVPGISDFQWVAVDETAALTVDQAARASERRNGSRQFMLLFYINPVYADRRAPLTVDDVPYWLLSGRLTRMALVDDAGAVVWEGSALRAAEEVPRALLELKQ